MKAQYRVWILVCFVLQVFVWSPAYGVTAKADDFRVTPYLQQPEQTAVTVRWFSENELPGRLTYWSDGKPLVIDSRPEPSPELAYNIFKDEPGGPHPATPFRHTVRISPLQPGTRYVYRVEQGGSTFDGEFQTAPDQNSPIRMIVYSDSETEPESSTSAPVGWVPSVGSNRPADIVVYPVDQTEGYRQNCKVIASRKPNLMLVVGDLVECGGEQRDWDEFWKHNAGEFNTLAGSIPLIAALGNHENYGGPGGAYTTPAANFSTDKFLTYFAVPDNGAANPKHRGRYYRLDYGPVSIITLDSSDGLPHMTAADTNHNLDGTNAPDFNPGSEQHRWMIEQLRDCQKNSRFTIVQFHHTMFGSGPHSVPFGHPNFSGQAGIAMRVLLPEFLKYGVDVVFSGHDEMLERSEASGVEILPNGAKRTHSLQLYDVGMGGDGLRGPSEGFENPNRKFLCHNDVPERWAGRKLESGGKHYGHLEVDVVPDNNGVWQMVITPVHVFPLMNDDGKVVDWERRLYPDPIVIRQPSTDR